MTLENQHNHNLTMTIQGGRIPLIQPTQGQTTGYTQHLQSTGLILTLTVLTVSTADKLFDESVIIGMKRY